MAQCGHLRRALAAALGILCFAGWSVAQNQTQSTSPATAGAAAGRASQTQPQQQQQVAVFQRVIYLSGQVLLEDGAVPPEPVRIERMCGGSAPRAEGYTDAHGRFSIQLGLDRSVISDASLGSSRDGEETRGGTFGSTASRSSTGGAPMGMDNRLVGCEIRAVLPGYRSGTVNLTGRRLMDKPDVGVIYLRRARDDEGVTVSVTELQAPKDARKAFDKGEEALRKGNFGSAQEHLSKAVELYPKYAAGWSRLGQALEQLKKPEDAVRAYQRAIESDPRFVPPYLQLAEFGHRRQDWSMVADITAKLIQLSPQEFPRAYLLSAAAHMNLRNWEQAERNAREGVRLDPQNRMPKVQHILGLVLANKGDFAEAAARLRAYLQIVPEPADAELVRKQLTEVERLAAAPARAQAPPAP